MKYYPVEALIIKALDYGESHKIFTLFSKEQGKFAAIARGVKKPKSALKGHLQLGNRCDFLLYHGRSLDTISQAVAKDSYPHIRENPRSYLYASYFMELLNISLPEREAEAEIFSLACQVFQALAYISPPALARYFELRLLAALGYDSDFKHCAACGGKLKEGFLSPRFPGVICEKCGSGYPVSPQALYALNYYRGNALETLERLKISPETARQASNATKHLLTYNLEKKIKSRDILGE